MDAHCSATKTTLSSSSSLPFLLGERWTSPPEPPSRWPWFITALLMGITLALVLSEGLQASFFRKRGTPRLISTEVASTQIKNDMAETLESGAILQVESRAQHQPTPEALSGMMLQTGIVRLPPLSVLKVYFPKPFGETPTAKLSSDKALPGKVSIDEVTCQYVVIRNDHATSECSFRYLAQGKLHEAEQFRLKCGSFFD